MGGRGAAGVVGELEPARSCRQIRRARGLVAVWAATGTGTDTGMARDWYGDWGGGYASTPVRVPMPVFKAGT